jgi:hypothetical protein
VPVRLHEALNAKDEDEIKVCEGEHIEHVNVESWEWDPVHATEEYDHLEEAEQLFANDNHTVFPLDPSHNKRLA